MQLTASCHCGAVHFSCESRAPYPFMYCYCSICRKTAGGSGSAINLHAEKASLTVQGKEYITVYRAWRDHPARTQRSTAERNFCHVCGSALWVWDPDWPELMHPFAAVVDTPLPMPPVFTHILLQDKPAWVAPPTKGSGDRWFDGYPDESLLEWHRRHGVIT